MPEARLQRTRDNYDDRICELCGRRYSQHRSAEEIFRTVVNKHVQALEDRINDDCLKRLMETK